MTARETVPVPAEERCPRCRRPLVMAEPCSHHGDGEDILEQARFTAMALDGAGYPAAARVVGELAGALRYQRRLNSALRAAVGAEAYRRADAEASRG